MKALYAIGFWLLFAGMPLFGQKNFSLEEAIRYANENNLRLRIQKTDIQDVDGQIKEYYSIGMPKLSGSASYNHYLKLPTSIFPNFISPAIYDVLFDENLLARRDIDAGPGVPVQFGTKNNLNASLEFSTMLFDGSFIVGLKMQKMYRELIEKQMGQTEADVRYQVTKAYLAALAIQDNLQLVQKNLDNLNKLRKELNEIYQAGLIEKLDLDRVDLSLQNLGSEKEKLDRISDITMQVLKFQMSYPQEDSIRLSEKLSDILNRSYVEIMDPAIQLNLQQRPEYPSIAKGIELAEINIRRLKSSYLPSLFGFATYQQSLQRTDLFDGNDNNWFETALLGVSMSVPIFDGLERKARISRAKTLLSKSQLQLTAFEQGVQLEFKNARTQYVNASTTLESRKKSLALAERIYETTNIKFREGIGSSLEITSAERDLYQAQANLLEAQVSLIQAKVDLDKSIGRL